MNNPYKSWSGLKRQAEGFLCDSLMGRISYFLTYYHEVHNDYGRAAIRLYGKDLICFPWAEIYHQEMEISAAHKDDPSQSYYDIKNKLKPDWDQNCAYQEKDFIDALLEFLNLPIETALISENYIIKILAILDRMTGKRMLQRNKDSEEYMNYPEWVQRFCKLRFEVEKV